MKFFKRILPLLLTVLILLGGFYGGNLLRSAIPSYKGIVIEAEKGKEDNPLLLIGNDEEITFSPWERYDPAENSPLLYPEESFSMDESIEAPVSYVVYAAYRYLMAISYNPSETENELPDYDQGDSAESSQPAETEVKPSREEEEKELYERLRTFILRYVRLQKEEDGLYFYLPETAFTFKGKTYYIKAAFADGDRFLYFTCKENSENAAEEPISSERLQKAAEEIPSFFSDTADMYEKFASTAQMPSEDPAYWDEVLKNSEINPLLYFLYTEILPISSDDTILQFLRSKKDILAYKNEILVVFSVPDFYLKYGYYVQSLVLFYDPERQCFTGFSLEI